MNMADFAAIITLFLLDFFLTLLLKEYYHSGRSRQKFFVHLSVGLSGLLHIAFVAGSSQEAFFSSWTVYWAWALFVYYLILYACTVFLTCRFGNGEENFIRIAASLALITIAAGYLIKHQINPAAAVILLLVLVYRYLRREQSREPLP